MKFLRVCMSIEPREVVDVPCDVFEVSEDNSVSVFYDGELYGFFSGPEYTYIIDEDAFTGTDVSAATQEPEEEEPEEGEVAELPAPTSLNGSYVVEKAPDDISGLDSASEAVEEPDADSR